MKVSAIKDNKTYVGHMTQVAKIAEVHPKTLQRQRKSGDKVYYSNNGTIVHFETIFI